MPLSSELPRLPKGETTLACKPQRAVGLRTAQVLFVIAVLRITHGVG